MCKVIDGSTIHSNTWNVLACYHKNTIYGGKAIKKTVKNQKKIPIYDDRNLSSCVCVFLFSSHFLISSTISLFILLIFL